MLSTITKLVPFGNDSRSKSICGYYLANIGSENGRSHNYVIGFFEQDSYFCEGGLVLFKVIRGWDRNKSNFELITEIFQMYGWMNEEAFRKVDLKSIDSEYIEYILKKYKERAKQDGIYEEQVKLETT